MLSNLSLATDSTSMSSSSNGAAAPKNSWLDALAKLKKLNSSMDVTEPIIENAPTAESTNSEGEQK